MGAPPNSDEFSVGASHGAYPLDLLFDELSLAVRRKTITALATAGFWPENAAHDAIMDDQRDRGEEIAYYVLERALGPSDFALLSTDVIFGLARGNFRHRLPWMASFGFELGLWMMAPEVRTDERGPKLAALCALFNIGITMFDLVCDAMPTGPSVLAATVDSSRLQRLLEQTGAAGEFAQIAQNMDDPELRILCKVIAAFFDGLAAHHFDCGADRRRLGEDLQAAYMAQLAASSVGAAREVLIQKSRLPFVIMLRIVRLCAGVDAARPGADKVVDAVATAFWLADDLADLVKDLRQGQSNALLPDVPADVHQQVRKLLDGSAIAAASVTLCESLDALRVPTLSGVANSDDGAFEAILLSYVRAWLE